MNTLFDVTGLNVKNGFEQFSSEFQTPPAVCNYMVSLLPEEVKTVLEPTPGQGNIVKALHDAVKIVTAPNDFFLLDKKLRFDAVVMNPPFSAKYANLEHAPADIKSKGMRLGYYILNECMHRSDIVICLMPSFVLSDSDVRSKHLMKYGIKSITQLPRKTFYYTRIQTIVMEMQKGFKGDTIFKIFNY